MSHFPDIPSRLQDLAPEWAHFCLSIENFINLELGITPQKRSFLLALSGGVDSTAQLLILYYLSQKWQSTLVAAHLNHCLRPEADLEASTVHNLCQKLNIPLFQGKSRVRTYSRKKSMGLEQSARILRYRFLQGLQAKQGTDFLITAHQLNDLAEDSLMRQMRGTGWPALAGMQAYIPEKQILRPLLLTPKAQLQTFLQYLKIPWQEDLSNLDPAFKRNRVRNSILPLMLQENPAYLQKVAWLWRQARLEHSYWEDKLDRLRIKEHKITNSTLLPAAQLNSVHQATRLRWYKDILERMGPGQILAHSLFALDQAFIERKNNKTFQFPGPKNAYLTAQGILFTN